MRWQLFPITMVLAVAACERPAAEPAPRHNRRLSAPSASSASAPSSRHATKKAPPKAACVVPLPAKPLRPLTVGPDPACPVDPTGRMQLQRMSLEFKSSHKTIDVEVAQTDPQRMRGLMYRTELSDDEGMVFVFERPKRHRFWMKNTCLPLDMLFVDAEGVIVGIEENVPTLNENTYFVRCASKYVIEVNAGWSRRYGVKPGDVVTFPSPSH